MDGRDENGNVIIGYSDDWENAQGYGKIWLGHSCDSWIIGNTVEAKDFVKKLQSIIEQVENNPQTIIDP